MGQTFSNVPVQGMGDEMSSDEDDEDVMYFR